MHSTSSTINKALARFFQLAEEAESPDISKSIKARHELQGEWEMMVHILKYQQEQIRVLMPIVPPAEDFRINAFQMLAGFAETAAGNLREVNRIWEAQWFETRAEDWCKQVESMNLALSFKDITEIASANLLAAQAEL